MDFEYPVFENNEQSFVGYEAPVKNDKNEEEYSEPMKAFYCTQPGCKKSFRYRSEILRHMVTHTSKRPYVCPHKNCMKGFKRSDALATHMRIHTREKTFECPYGSCKSTFSTKAGLKYHTLKHKSEKHSLNNIQSRSTVMEQELKYETNNSQDVFVDSGESMLESSMDNQNYQEQYSMLENNYNSPIFEAHQFDNTHIQQISPLGFGEKGFYSEKNEYDTYMTNYSTPSNQSYSNKDAETYLNYPFTNATQNCAANLINEDVNSLVLTKSNRSDGSDKLYGMMQKIVEENSNLKKKLDFYQRFMRGSQQQGEEQGSIF